MRIAILINSKTRPSRRNDRSAYIYYESFCATPNERRNRKQIDIQPQVILENLLNPTVRIFDISKGEISWRRRWRLEKNFLDLTIAWPFHAKVQCIGQFFCIGKFALYLLCGKFAGFASKLLLNSYW